MITLTPTTTPHGNEIGVPDTYVVQRVVPDAATHDFLVRRQQASRVYWWAVMVAAALALAGVIALVAIALDGGPPWARWGYTAATTVFLLSTAQAAPPLALASRLGRGWWGVPLRRLAECGALAGVVTAPALILLETHLPDWRERPSIWQGWPGAPQVWDGVAVVLLALAGLALVYFGAVPDVATLRALANEERRTKNEELGHSFFILRSSFFVGTERQWRALARAQIWLGALYSMLFVYVHLVVVSDLAMSLVPAWGSANMPPYQVVSSLEGGVAAAIVALAVARRFGHLQRYVERDSFHAAAKILLTLALLWFYFFWSEFLTYWYGRTPDEQRLLELLVVGPYFAPFLGAFALSFLAPFLLLIWNPIRRSIRGVTVAAALALAGTFLDRVRLYVPSWSVAGPPQKHLASLPPAQWPGVFDVLVIVGLPAAAILLALLALRFVPALPLWEMKAVRLLRSRQRYVKATVPLIAKPT
jgi:hypothetical protein